MNVYTYFRELLGLSKVTLQASTRMDPQIDPKELPEYLQPLTKGIADGLSIHQWEELAAVIYEFRMWLAKVQLTGPG